MLMRVLVFIGFAILMTGCTPKAFVQSDRIDRLNALKIEKKNIKLEKESKNPRCVFRRYYARALGQDPYAQYMVSMLYLKGAGVHYSLEKSVLWYNRAQRQSGNALAKYKIGKMFLESDFFEKDEQEAIKWLIGSADQGCVLAQNLLGDLYLKGGTSFKKNEKKAYYWYTQSAKQANPLGQYNLGLLYYNGQGVKQNRHTAAQWFHKAAIQGADYAQYNLARMYREGTGLKKNEAKAYGWWSLGPERRFEDTKTEYQALVDPMTSEQRAKAWMYSQQYKHHYRSHK